MAATATLLTVDEFDELEDTDGLELVDGVIEETCMGAESGLVAAELFVAVREFARANRAGLVLPNDVGINLSVLGRQLLRKPDGMFFRRGRLPGNRVPKGWLTVVPDIAWEVVSPRDEVETLERKLLDYREAGIPLTWVIFPGTRTARIQHSDGHVSFIDENGHLDGESLLPGFRLRLGDLFAELDSLADLEPADA